MNKRHIPGFFDALARTPSFVFLCSMFLCGAAAGGLTGLHAAEGDCTLVWECTQNAAPWAKSRAPFALCVASAALSALLRVLFAILLAG